MDFNVGESSYIGERVTEPQENSKPWNETKPWNSNTQVPLSKPWNHFDEDLFQKEDKIEKEDKKHEDVEDEQYYSDDSNEPIKPKKDIVFVERFQNEYLYLFGILLLAFAIGFSYIRDNMCEVPSNEEMNLTVAYALGK
jgi:hypothetical protein